MTITVGTAVGGRLALGTEGYAESFVDGLPFMWEDAHDYWQTMFDEATIANGRLELQPETITTFTSLDPEQTVGHWLIARDVGMSDNFEVQIRWRQIGVVDWLSQASPVAFVDLEADEPLQMGVLPIWDVGVPATYVQNAFRQSPISNVFDNDYYTFLGGSEGRGFIPSAGVNWISLRCVNGSLTYYWNGRRRGPAVDVPAWAEGRTWMGVHVIGTDFQLGGTYPLIFGGATVTVPSPVVIDHWRARPFPG